MLRRLICFSIICMGTAHGTVRHVPIKSGVVLKPGETYTAQVESTKPVEIGWMMVPAKPCSTDCVEATQVGTGFRFATELGGGYTYQPTDGKVAIQYKNISHEPVTIDVFRTIRVCDAESCRFLDNTKQGHTLVFKVAEFKSISTSKDESYSVISGVAESGRPFRFTAVWFTDDKTYMNLGKGCTTWIKRYVDSHTPKEQYRPYIIAGQNVGNGDRIILKLIDDCVPRAPHFGVPEQNVFK